MSGVHSSAIQSTGSCGRTTATQFDSHWFRGVCNEAGLPNGCATHGLRKAAARCHSCTTNKSGKSGARDSHGILAYHGARSPARSIASSRQDRRRFSRVVPPIQARLFRMR